MPAMIYWSGILVKYPVNNIPPQFHTALKKILIGEYKAADLKKIDHIYRIKLNAAHRLLFSSHKDLSSRKQYLVLRDIYSDHDEYEQQIQDASVQRKYREWNLHQTTLPGGFREIQVEELVKEDAPPQQASPDDNPDEKDIVLFPTPSEVIELSLEQQRILNTFSISLPAVLSGEAGTGKTILFTAIVHQLLQRHPELTPGSILWVTDASHVLTQTERFFEAQLCLPEQKGVVVFKTYKQLVNELHPNDTLVPLNHLALFLAKHLQQSPFLSKHEITYWLDECRLISGCENLNAYLEMKRKTSLIASQEENPEEIITQKTQLWTLFDRYCAQLKEHQQFDIVYSRFQGHPTLRKFVVGDEAHVLSAGQLNNLRRLAENNNFMICIHEGQRIKDRRFSHLTYLSQHAFPQIHHYELTQMFRCPYEVQEFVQLFIDAKTRLNPNASSQLSQRNPTVASSNQVVQVFETLTPAHEKLILKQAQRHDFAIVTHPDLITQTQEKYHTGNVFSVEEVIGLQFPVVFIYNLITESDFIKANQRLTMVRTKREQKDDETRDELEPLFNQFYVACTRVVQSADATLYFHQAGLHPNRTPYLFEQLRRFITHLASTPALTTSNALAWEKQSRALEEMGLTQQAQTILKFHPQPQVDDSTAVSPTEKATPLNTSYLSVTTQAPQEGASPPPDLHQLLWDNLTPERLEQAFNLLLLKPERESLQFLFSPKMVKGKGLTWIESICLDENKANAFIHFFSSDNHRGYFDYFVRLFNVKLYDASAHFLLHTLFSLYYRKAPDKIAPWVYEMIFHGPRALSSILSLSPQNPLKKALTLTLLNGSHGLKSFLYSICKITGDETGRFPLLYFCVENAKHYKLKIPFTSLYSANPDGTQYNVLLILLDNYYYSLHDVIKFSERLPIEFLCMKVNYCLSFKQTIRQPNNQNETFTKIQFNDRSMFEIMCFTDAFMNDERGGVDLLLNMHPELIQRLPTDLFIIPYSGLFHTTHTLLDLLTLHKRGRDLLKQMNQLDTTLLIPSLINVDSFIKSQSRIGLNHLTYSFSSALEQLMLQSGTEGIEILLALCVDKVFVHCIYKKVNVLIQENLIMGSIISDHYLFSTDEGKAFLLCIFSIHPPALACVNPTMLLEKKNRARVPLSLFWANDKEGKQLLTYLTAPQPTTSSISTAPDAFFQQFESLINVSQPGNAVHPK